MSAPHVIQTISQSAGAPVGGFFRQRLATLRNRIFESGEKRRRRTQVVSASIFAHRPVWITAGGAAYTTMVAFYLTSRLLRRVPI